MSHPACASSRHQQPHRPIAKDQRALPLLEPQPPQPAHCHRQRLGQHRRRRCHPRRRELQVAALSGSTRIAAVFEADLTAVGQHVLRHAQLPGHVRRHPAPSSTRPAHSWPDGRTVRATRRSWPGRWRRCRRPRCARTPGRGQPRTGRTRIPAGRGRCYDGPHRRAHGSMTTCCARWPMTRGPGRSRPAEAVRDDLLDQPGRAPSAGWRSAWPSAWCRSWRPRGPR